MADENREEFGAALAGTDALTAFLEEAAVGLSGQTGETLAEALGGLVTEVDRRALTGSFADYLASVMHAALEAGIWGWHDDDLAFARDWGFTLDEIAVPVTVWQGREDAMVPFAHGAGSQSTCRAPGRGSSTTKVTSRSSLRFAEIVDELVRA